jgi:hypothetical protein
MIIPTFVCINYYLIQLNMRYIDTAKIDAKAE